MPRARAFDKKNSVKFALVHRQQDDPLIHDAEAPQQVFTEVGVPQTRPSQGKKKSKVKQRGDLEDEFGLAIRANEGEAAEHGIFFDDTKYDYMQHMRDLGSSTEGMWVEAPLPASGKAKQKQRLEDAISEMSLDDDAYSSSSFEPPPMMGRFNPFAVDDSYQKMQNVPDAIAGFQPDMDPRLREVLEALEDEEYVDDEEDIFSALTGEGGEEISQDEWESSRFEDDDEDGWESDDTTKPIHEYSPAVKPSNLKQADLNPTVDPALATSDTNDGVRLKPSTPSSIVTSSSNVPGSRKKKRGGALTDSSSFSMTSSVLPRSEALSVLDSRFDKLAESYMENDDADDVEDDGDKDDGVSLASAQTHETGGSNFSRASRTTGSAWGASQVSDAPSLVPANFDAVMDEFIDANGSKKGRKMRKAGKQGVWGTQSGMQQLEEIRRGLGPAKVR